MVVISEPEGVDIPYKHMIEKEQPSEIQQFFHSGCAFVTGGTGYLGSLIIEKLLRTCPDIKKVYVLMREKKGKSIEKRFEDVVNNRCFEPLRRKQPDFAKKCVIIPGDCQLSELGLLGEDRQKLINDVTCIFHCAATVRFDEKLRNATYINARATNDIIALAKEMKSLKSFVYISTAYANCVRKDIKEEFYDTPLPGKNLIKLVDLLDDSLLNDLTSSMIGKWPNTYVFTKAIAEDIIRNEAKCLPIAIVRPSIVIATVKEPLAGWIDNIYGATGVVLGVALGLIRTLHCKADNLADMVPADFVINCAIAAAWDVGTKNAPQIQQTISEEKEKFDVPIYNYTCSAQKPITWRRFMELSEKCLKKVPTPLLVWHYCFFLSPTHFIHLICVFFLHMIPAYTVDFLCLCIGKERLMVKGYKKIHKFLDVLSYFSTQQWNFDSTNMQALWKRLNPTDQKLFDFNFGTFDWESYSHIYASGGRVYLCKDPMDTIPQGRIKYRKLQIAHYTLVTIIALGTLKLATVLWSALF